MGKIDAALRAWEDLDESEKDTFDAIIAEQRQPQRELLSPEQQAEINDLVAQLDAGTLELASDERVVAIRRSVGL